MLDAGYSMLVEGNRASRIDIRFTTPSVWIGGFWVELLYLSGVVL
ncbi:hypothetical protein ES707_14180 [subsurface metagenome]